MALLARRTLSTFRSLSSPNFNTFSFLLHFSSSSSFVAPSAVHNPHSVLIDYLINTLGFSKTQVDSVSKYFQSRNTLPKQPDSVVNLLLVFGLSETQVQKALLVAPCILSFNVDKTLKPKLSLFQNELGLTGSHLGRFISSDPHLLSLSLERRLIPNISFLKRFIPKIEIESEERERFIAKRCSSILGMDPKKLLSNISFLQSCGILQSQLSGLLKRNSAIFIRKESELRALVCKAQEMGFSCDSRMLVHALSVLNGLSSKSLESKFQLLRSFGFSQEECSAMFRRTPALLSHSEKRLKLGIDFFDGAGFERKMLVQNPSCLMYSLEKRVIPRFRVYQILKSKQQLLLNNKCPSFSYLLKLTEKKLLEKYVFNFGDNAEELLSAYNIGNVVEEQVPS